MAEYTGLTNILAQYTDRMRHDCYAVCSTQGSTVAKVAELKDTSHFTLTEGVKVTVMFTNANTASNITLSLKWTDTEGTEHTTPAASVYEYGSTASAANQIRAGEAVSLTYNGSSWLIARPFFRQGVLNTQGSQWCETERFSGCYILDNESTVTGSLYLMSRNEAPVASGNLFYFVSLVAKTLAAGTYKVYINGVDSGTTVTLSASKSLTARYSYNFTAGGTGITSFFSATPTYSYTATVPNFRLEAGATVKVTFQYACPAYANGTSSTYAPTLNVNGTGTKAIYVLSRGTKVRLAPKKVHGVYMYWGSYTTLELMYDGSDWLVMGNPPLLTYNAANEGYTVYADGKIEQWGVITDQVDETIINFPVLFNANYSFICGPYNNSTDPGAIIGHTVFPTTIRTYSSTGVKGIRWSKSSTVKTVTGVQWYAIGY